jgi:hypothetical protein
MFVGHRFDIFSPPRQVKDNIAKNEFRGGSIEWAIIRDFQHLNRH